MKLADYLRRIDYSGPVRADLETLNALHAAHVRSVPFENLDVHGQRPIAYTVEAAFDQIVARRQGGWCYEMNGLFEWVLREIGFDQTRLAAGVRRSNIGDEALGNHLCLMVHLDTDYLVDVGFGNSQLFPIPLEEGVTRHEQYQMALGIVEGGHWRLYEGGPGAMVNYDFIAAPADEDLLKSKHDEQITDPNSIFRKTLTAKIRRGRSYRILRGRMLETHYPGRKTTEEIQTEDELVTVLKESFDLVEPDLSKLWPKITARHRQLFPHAAGVR